MSSAAESSPAPEAMEPPPEGESAPQAPPEGAQERDPARAAASREAAAYRVRLREAEQALGERDEELARLRARIDDHDREAVERLAGARMILPADLWTVVQLSDLRAEDGALDVEQINDRVAEVLAERPHWRRPQPDLGAGPRASAPRDEGLGLAKLLGKR